MILNIVNSFIYNILCIQLFKQHQIEVNSIDQETSPDN